MPGRKLLLTSVFKPFGVDDAYGVKENVCELMHNQVTRMQGLFSVRSHNRSFGLTLIAENLLVPTTVLDFPTIEEFLQELETGEYSHVGISFIVPNFDKARHMVSLIRTHDPAIQIFLGGHGAAIPNLGSLIPNEGICRGEGVRWLRERFGEPLEAPFKHPIMEVDCWRQLLGVPVPHNKGLLIPGVGCANKCSFCCTSHFFDGYTPFFDQARDLFEVMKRIADTLQTREFFVLDENFLDQRDRVRELLDLMRQEDRRFKLEIFSSLRTVASYDPEVLLELGVQFIWIGVESKRELFDKVKGISAREVISRLRDHGISVLASTILFLDHHDRTRLQEDVDYTISLEADFVQFMELAPLPGTAVFADLQGQGRICDSVPYREWHGQDKIWFTHPNFSRDESKRILDAAFQKDFDQLGPSLLRIAETRMRALNLPTQAGDAFAQARRRDLLASAREMRPLIPILIRMAPNDQIRDKARQVSRAYRQHFGPPTWKEMGEAAIVSLLARLEDRKIRQGRSVHQPLTYLDRYRQEIKT